MWPIRLPNTWNEGMVKYSTIPTRLPKSATMNRFRSEAESYSTLNRLLIDRFKVFKHRTLVNLELIWLARGSD